MKADVCFKHLGQYISFCLGTEKQERLGRIVQIKINLEEKMVVGIEEEGYIEEYSLEQVNLLKNKESQKSLTKQIIKQINKNMNSFKYDLSAYYEEELQEILAAVEEEYKKQKILEAFDIKNKEVACEDIYPIIESIAVSEEKREFLCGIVAYKQHDFETGYRIFSKRWLQDKTNPERCRDFLLIADEFGNDLLCFYLLNYFFKNHGRYLETSYYTNLWWKYLFYSGKYNNFELLYNMEITDWNVRVLIDSFIYIFHTYNMNHLADALSIHFVGGNNNILQGNKDDLKDTQETIEALNLYKNYIPETAESYYCRFELCVDHIIALYDEGRVDISSEEKCGYVYEYVKSRNYGFIIGYDFQKYFFHWDFVSSNLKKKILDNIYSGKEIKEEDRIQAIFRSEYSNKKIQAMDII